MSVQGTWTLVIQNNSTTGGTGTLNSWSLTFQKPLPTIGPGRAGQRQRQRQFPHLHAGPDRRAVEPGVDGGRPGVDRWRLPATLAATLRAGSAGWPSIRPTPRATRSTSPAPAAASGRRPTSSRPAPRGPTWIPLTDFGPTSGVNIGGIAVFGRNNDPNQSIIIAATGEGDTGTPGVGFLISQDGGATWNLYDSTNNVDASGNLLPISSASRDRTFVGDDGVQGRRRSQAHAHRPGDHLRRPERHQRRHLAERGHGQDLAADARRPGDRRGPRPGQRHGPRPRPPTPTSRATSRSSTPPSAAWASS